MTSRRATDQKRFLKTKLCQQNRYLRNVRLQHAVMHCMGNAETLSKTLWALGRNLKAKTNMRTIGATNIRRCQTKTNIWHTDHLANGRLKKPQKVNSLLSWTQSERGILLIHTNMARPHQTCLLRL